VKICVPGYSLNEYKPAFPGRQEKALGAGEQDFYYFVVLYNAKKQLSGIVLFF
jgi:hypothetical protein